MMNHSEIAKYRLVSQQIGESEIRTAPQMVRWFGAIQGQEYAQTKWGLGLRLPHLVDADIENDLSAGKIVRTHLLRPTWHFVSAEDIRWMLMLTAPRVHAANAYIYRKTELESRLLHRCHKIISQALEREQYLTRDELNQELKNKKIEADGIRLALIMMHAELEGVICSGPRKGSQFSYRLMDERIPPAMIKSREEALYELTRRYFSSRGPATLKDFSTWSGLTITECKKGVQSLNGGFGKVVTEGETYIFSQASASNPVSKREVYLLPIYDEYIMGYRNRQAIFLTYNRMKPKPLLRFGNTIMMDGQIIGTWKRTIKQKLIEFEHDLFVSLKKFQKVALEKSIARFNDFTSASSHAREGSVRII